MTVIASVKQINQPWLFLCFCFFWCQLSHPHLSQAVSQHPLQPPHHLCFKTFSFCLPAKRCPGFFQKCQEKGFIWLLLSPLKTLMFLYISRSELFVELIQSPEDVIQLDSRSISSWKMAESYLVQRGRYRKICHLHKGWQKSRGRSGVQPRSWCKWWITEGPEWTLMGHRSEQEVMFRSSHWARRFENDW